MKLKTKIIELETQLKKIEHWEEEDLNSKANFDLNCIYKIDTSVGHSMIITGVTTTNIYFNYKGSSYNTAYTDRRAITAGWVITKMMKYKI